jgi:hypothetical protein
MTQLEQRKAKLEANGFTWTQVTDINGDAEADSIVLCNLYNAERNVRLAIGYAYDGTGNEEFEL